MTAMSTSESGYEAPSISVIGTVTELTEGAQVS